MPHYDYECQKCKHVFEVFQSMTDKHLSKCPKCKGPVKRLIVPGAGIIFKGSGFYETDYKKKPCEKAAPSCPANCKHKH
jgi:putative FmdB family regulatory protein